MKILVVNQNWFVEEFKALGHEVMTIGTRSNVDYIIEFPIEDINHVIKRLNFKPDFILVEDESAPICISGLEDVKVPICFYSVDTHQHCAVHRQLFKAFDFGYVAHKDYLPEVANETCQIKWLPLYCSLKIEPSEEKEYGASFVGTLNPRLNPDRVKFFEDLQKVITVNVMTGDFTQVFPKSEIVINQTVKGDLNFRVFEALASGSMLLTEASGNGLFDLFQEGVHLVTYKKGDVQDAATKIRYYLEHKDEAKKIGEAGRLEILRSHTARQRAETILHDFATIKKTNHPEKCYAFMQNYIWASEIILCKSKVAAIAYCEQALRCVVRGLKLGVKPTELVVPYIIVTCLEFDCLLKVKDGFALLQSFTDKFKDITFFKLALFWHCIQRNSESEALEIQNKYFQDVEYNFLLEQANQAVGALIKSFVMTSASAIRFEEKNK